MILSQEQLNAVEAKEEQVVVVAAAGSGKSIPDYCEIPTYEMGLKRVDEIRVGDLLIDREGNPTKVTAIFPQQEEKEIVKIYFEDGRIAECCEEHLWNIQYKSHRKYDYRTVSTKEMIAFVNKKGYKKEKQGYTLKIQINEPVKYYKKDLKIDPYILGLFLGDGSFRESTLHFYTNDYELIENIEYFTKWTSFRYKNDQHKYRYRFKKDYINNVTVKDFLKEYPELVDKLSYEKFIPEDYKFSSIEQRYALIQGLMDTDGYVDSKGRCSFTSTSLRLIKDVEFILRSLGFITTIEKDTRDKYTLGICYSLNIQGTIKNKKKLFRLSRKIERLNNLKESNYAKNTVAITKIEKTKLKTKMTCFLVDNEEHLFLMNDFIVTHNTTVITERIRYLLNSGENPANIYAITFTNNAAQEMKERLCDISEIGDVFIGTIHSLANRILVKNGIKTADAIQNQDFDQLFHLLKHNVVLPKVKHLLIDEFQDITKDFYNFYFRDLKPQYFFGVGDCRQAIYSFSGGSLEWMNKVLSDPKTTIYELNTCYRCPDNIIKFANKFINGDPDIYFTDIKSNLDNSATIYTSQFSVSNLIDKLLLTESYKDWFVLCRSNQQVEDILHMLLKKGIPAETFKKSDQNNNELSEKMKRNTVKVLTIHSAKGLEAKHVAVVGAKNFTAEEKRLCYVAATRAQESLIWYKGKATDNNKCGTFAFGNTNKANSYYSRKKWR